MRPCLLAEVGGRKHRADMSEAARIHAARASSEQGFRSCRVVFQGHRACELQEKAPVTIRSDGCGLQEVGKLQCIHDGLQRTAES